MRASLARGAQVVSRVFAGNVQIEQQQIDGSCVVAAASAAAQEVTICTSASKVFSSVIPIAEATIG
jgi:hypothetical protein